MWKKVKAFLKANRGKIFMSAAMGVWAGIACVAKVI